MYTHGKADDDDDNDDDDADPGMDSVRVLGHMCWKCKIYVRWMFRAHVHRMDSIIQIA